MKSTVKYLIAIVILAGVAAGWFLLGGRTEVAVATVLRDTAVDAVPASVKVDPEFQLTITSDVLGLVRKSNLKRGQVVKAGDILMEIDPGAYTLAQDQLEKQLANTRAQYALDFDQRNALERRKEDLANLERRTRSGDYPELEFKRRQEEFRILSEQQEKERLAREQAITNMLNSIQVNKDLAAMCVVRSPAAGTVTEIFAQPGEVINVRAPLVRLYSQALQVEARINEEDFSGIHPGLDASVRFLAYGPELYPAKVVKVLPNADPQNQQYRAYLEVTMPADRLIPGLSGEASLIRNRRENTLVVPRSALLNDAVFVIENGVARRRQVELGFKSLSMVEIRKGVGENSVVATSGLESLSDGTWVKPLQ